MVPGILSPGAKRGRGVTITTHILSFLAPAWSVRDSLCIAYTYDSRIEIETTHSNIKSFTLLFHNIYVDVFVISRQHKRT
jgi:hypothetical protein